MVGNDEEKGVSRQVREMFYEMYPESDPKYWSYFKFVKRTKGGKLVSIDVYYRSGRSTVRIIKGKNDKDARWSRFLHSYRENSYSSHVKGKTWKLSTLVRRPGISTEV